MLLIQYEYPDPLMMRGYLTGYIPVMGVSDKFQISEFEEVRTVWQGFVEHNPEVRNPVLIRGETHEHSQMLTDFDKYFRKR